MQLSEILQYVLGHAKVSQCFPGWSNDQITMYLLNAVKDDEIFVATKRDRIKGLLHATVEHSERLIRVHAILADDAIALRTFLVVWNQRHPEYKVTGKRSGKLYTYKLANFQRYIKASGHAIPTIV